jgi:hypothetical protein
MQVRGHTSADPARISKGKRQCHLERRWIVVKSANALTEGDDSS